MTDPGKPAPISGLLDLAADDLAAYRRLGGYQAAVKIASLGGRHIVQVMRDADVRARDGSGYPVYLAWRAAMSVPARWKYVVCLADEPDPDGTIYRELIRRSPHAVLEGMICGAVTIGAEEGFIYLRHKDSELIPILERALDEAHAEGFLGDDALLNVHLIVGERSFLCGSNNPIYEHLEENLVGRGPEARGSFLGLFGWPTVVHDPETWAQGPMVLTHGADWYRSLGVDQAGTKLLYLGGVVNNSGLVEVPLGQTMGKILVEQAGGTVEGKAVKAIQLGGASGGFLPAEHLNAALDFEELAELGLSMGSGGFQVLGDGTCMVAQALALTVRCVEGGCRNRETCARKLEVIQRLLIEVEEGRGSPEHMTSLESQALDLINPEFQGAERSVARATLTALKYFRKDFEDHIFLGTCASGQSREITSAPCQAACPAGIDIPTYLALVGRGEYEQAVEIIRQDNPFPWACGLICTRPCESVCIRGEMDEALSIMSLKAVAAGKTFERTGDYPLPAKEPDRAEKVAVVGAGPAGLSAAYFLALKGYPVTVFESLPKAGGLLRYGIPEYRLPKAILDREIEAIQQLGVEIKCDSAIGPDFSLDHLRGQGYKAFFLGLGASKSVNLGLEGEGRLRGVLPALDFLRSVALGVRTKPADKVVVVGGGNAAIDAARTCIRLGCEKVYIAYRRTRKEMPAWAWEVHEAEEEGVELLFLTIPKQVLGEDDRVIGMECLRAELGEPDASGRRRPAPVEGSEFVLEVGAVIAAIGQQPDPDLVAEGQNVTVSGRGRVVVDLNTLQTDAPDVFAGGDVVTGAATVVAAVGAGKWAAQSIDAYLNGEPIPQGPPLKKPRTRIESVEVTAEEKTSRRRPQVPTIEMDRRSSSFDQVELPLNEDEAREEATRCLRCDLCVGCRLCQIVCSEMGVGGMELTTTGSGRRALTDFHRPAKSCIGCGSCVQACPHANIRMADDGHSRRILFAGAETAKLELKHCESCGAPIAPSAQLSHLEDMVDDDAFRQSLKRLCPDCARKIWGKGQFGDVIWFPPPAGPN